MNIDISNGLNKVFLNCDRVSSSSLKNEFGYSTRTIVKEDLLRFINFISMKNCEERGINFSKEYLESYSMEAEDFHWVKVPTSIVMFRKYDTIYHAHTCEDAEVLFTIIGKFYLLSKYDKAEINQEKFLQYISMIQHHISNDQLKKEIKSNEATPLEKKALRSKDENEANNAKVGNEKSLVELLEDLNSLIGLDKVKSEVNKRINQIQVDKKRQEVGLKKSSMSLHLVFTGNPGTGKTTVARKLAAIYKQLGVLSQGQFVEVDRGSLVGGYVGSTAIKTQEVIDKAMGGILFIDEAYTLTHGKGETDFGQEAVDTLLKAMEDKRDDFVVIVAGYTKEMDEFIKSNPGLQSRFNKYIEFEDYTSDEMYRIFKLICKSDEKVIDKECDEFLTQYFVKLTDHKPENFANGRTVRNYYEKVIETLNNRLARNLDSVTKEDLQTIRLVDLQE